MILKQKDIVMIDCRYQQEEDQQQTNDIHRQCCCRTRQQMIGISTKRATYSILPLLLYICYLNYSVITTPTIHSYIVPQYLTPSVLQRTRQQVQSKRALSISTTVRLLESSWSQNNVFTVKNMITDDNIDIDNDGTNDNESVVVTWLDEKDMVNTRTNQQHNNQRVVLSSSKNDKQQQQQWGSKLSPKVKERIILAGQNRAIANKQKRTSDMDRKRRQLLFIKERQREKKRSAQIDRPIPIQHHQQQQGIQRIPLYAYQPGMQCYGTCISLTSYGAYIDIGTECDGILHVTQMHTNINNNTSSRRSSSGSTFIQHPKQIVQPGDEIYVTIRSINPIRKKLHLTLLPWDVVEQQLEAENERKKYVVNSRSTSFDDDDDEDDDDNNDDKKRSTTDFESSLSYTDRILLQDIQVDDELWGEIRRVTDFGAYVEVGAIVDGFLHYMDHPTFTYEFNRNSNNNNNQKIVPSMIMQAGDRIRVWVSDIDLLRNRIKLTAHRPNHLPGPRREM